MNAQRQEVVPANPSFTPVPSGLLQRKCACGTHTMSGGECAECGKKKQTLQRASLSPRESRIEGEGEVPPIVHEALRSSGQPLDSATRAFFESRFGHDFSQVRVRTDAKGAESAQAVNALAYTVGRDVVFGAGQYAPGTTAGRRLLAHELAHVVQQGGQAEASGMSTAISPSDSLLEQEAVGWADAAMRAQEPNLGEHLVAQQAAALALYRRRSPDVEASGYHSFYIRAMLPGNRTEVRVQFYQDPPGEATFAVWYQETGTMQRVSFTPAGAIQPVILDEHVGIVTFDLNGDGAADITLIARPNQQTLAVDFSATLNGSQFFTMTAAPPQRPSNYVPGRGRYIGRLPDGRRFYFTETFDQRGPRYVDDTGQPVDPALEAQGAAIMRAVGQGYLIGYAILLSIAAGYALVGVAEVGAAGAGAAGVGAAEVGTAAVARQGLIAALRQAGVRFTEQAIVGITRTVATRIVWLETGTASAGLTHIMQRHGSQFSQWGLRSAQQVNQLIINTLATQAPVATQPGGAFDFAIRVGGVERLLRIVIGSNGFIVTAHPL